MPFADKELKNGVQWFDARIHHVSPNGAKFFADFDLEDFDINDQFLGNDTLGTEWRWPPDEDAEENDAKKQKTEAETAAGKALLRSIRQLIVSNESEQAIAMIDRALGA